MAHVIALLNMKGGVGKTTLAFNLASFLHKNEPANVLLIDLDPQFNATQCVMDYETFEGHRKKNGTIADLFIDQPKLSLKKKQKKKSPITTLHNVRKTSGKCLDLLPSELKLAWVVKNPAQMDFRLEKLLESMRSQYDFIIIDCAPTDSVLTTMALTASDYLLIPMRPDRFSILGFFNLTETIETFRDNCPDPNGVKVLGIVFTQVTEASPVETEAMAEVMAAAKKDGTYVFKNHLKYSTSYIRSIRDQTPIFETLWAKHSPRTQVAKIADEMLAQIQAAPVPAGKAKKK